MMQSENITDTFATTLPEWKLHLPCKVLLLQQLQPRTAIVYFLPSPRCQYGQSLVIFYHLKDRVVVHSTKTGNTSSNATTSVGRGA